MGINLRELQHFTVTDLSGGVNEFASTYKVKDNELVKAVNGSFKDSGGIKVRLGDQLLDQGNVSGITGGITNMYRYVTSVGGRKTILYTDDGYIWIDNDGVNQFVRVPSSTAQEILSNDGHCRFSQYLDTVIFGTDRDGMYLYNPNVSTIEFGDLSVSASGYTFIDTTLGAGPVVETTGGSISVDNADGIYYYYRFTLDYQYGDFIGESGPQYFDSFNRIQYVTGQAYIASGDTNRVDLTRYPGILDIPSTIARINVYRSNPHVTQLSNQKMINSKLEFFYAGSIEASTFNSASDLGVVFSDGGLSPGLLMEYNKMDVPPMARFHTMHKGRIWYANVQYREGSIEAWSNGSSRVEDYESYPHRVFISSLNSNGNFEPGVCYTDQFRDIDPRGSGITGIWSYQNEVILIFKANSMWAIIGDDPHPQTGNLRIRNISNSVGCIAPESLCEVEGRLTWLSNSGIYYWDGGSKPAQLKTDNIVKSIQSIPKASKKEVSSVYDRKQRELLVAHSDPESSGKNRKVAKFDLRTSAWSIDEYISGIGSFITIDQPDEDVAVYAGANDTSGRRGVYGALSQLNTGTSSSYYQTGAENWLGQDISFEFQTKFYDGGAPFMDKNFKAIAIDLKTPVELTLDVLCDNRLDTRSSVDDHPITLQGSFTIPIPDQTALIWATSSATSEIASRRWYNASVDDPPAQILNTNAWAKTSQGTSVVYLDDRCWGKRISLIISGDVKQEVNIDSITVFYKAKEGTRGN